MTGMSRLDSELIILLQYRYSRNKMEVHTFKWLLKNQQYTQNCRDMAELAECAERLVADFLRVHWFQYLKNKIAILLNLG